MRIERRNKNYKAVTKQTKPEPIKNKPITLDRLKFLQHKKPIRLNRHFKRRNDQNLYATKQKNRTEIHHQFVLRTRYLRKNSITRLQHSY